MEFNKAQMPKPCGKDLGSTLFDRGGSGMPIIKVSKIFKINNTRDIPLGKDQEKNR